MAEKVSDGTFFGQLAKASVGFMFCMSALGGLNRFMVSPEHSLTTDNEAVSIKETFKTYGGFPFLPLEKTVTDTWNLAEGSRCHTEKMSTIVLLWPSTNNDTRCSPLTGEDLENVRFKSEETAIFLDANKSKTRVFAPQLLTPGQ